jgi:hypothetical protein
MCAKMVIMRVCPRQTACSFGNIHGFLPCGWALASNLLIYLRQILDFHTLTVWQLPQGYMNSTSLLTICHWKMSTFLMHNVLDLCVILFAWNAAMVYGKVNAHDMHLSSYWHLTICP